MLVVVLHLLLVLVAVAVDAELVAHKQKAKLMTAAVL